MYGRIEIITAPNVHKKAPNVLQEGVEETAGIAACIVQKKLDDTASNVPLETYGAKCANENSGIKSNVVMEKKRHR